MSKSLLINGSSRALLGIRRDAKTISGNLDGAAFSFRIIHREGGWVVLQDAAGHHHRLYVSAQNAKGERRVMLEGLDVTLAAATRSGGSGGQAATRAAAPMPGTVQAIKVKVGDAVKAGDTVAIMEAMKMQIAIPAPFDGTVKEICAQAGAQVTEGTELVKIES